MKRKIHTLLACALLGLLTISCIDDSYTPGSGGTSTYKGGPTMRAERKAGRIALGYCTYYGYRRPSPPPQSRRPAGPR